MKHNPPPPPPDPRLQLLDTISEIISAANRLEDERGRRIVEHATERGLIPILMQIRELIAIRKDMGARPAWVEMLAEVFLNVATETDARKLQDGLTKLAAVAACWKTDLRARNGQDEADGAGI